MFHNLQTSNDVAEMEHQSHLCNFTDLYIFSDEIHATLLHIMSCLITLICPCFFDPTYLLDYITRVQI